MAVLSETTGFFASALVLATFMMKDMRMLRLIAVFSNVAFIAYGALDWLLPVLGLHLLLLPLNLLRLKEMLAGVTARAGLRQMLADIWNVQRA
jgi:hypothetical protein